MKKNHFLPFVLLAAGISALAESPRERLLSDMAELDRAYIPVLALTSQEKEELSWQAMGTFERQWREFKSSHYEEHPEDVSWKSDFDVVEAHISEARTRILSRLDLKTAHQELEPIRTILLKLRQRHGMEYFLDYLTEFHEPMETIVLLGKSKTPETMTPADVQRLRKLTLLAEQSWKAVINAAVDSPAFPLDAEKVEQIRPLIDLESKAIKRLKDLIESNDVAALPAAAVGLKPNFAKLFMSFGKFPEDKGKSQSQTQAHFTVHPIGYVEKTEGRTTIVLDKAYEPGLLRMERLSEIWVLWWFDKNDTPEKRTILQVHPQGNPSNPLTGVFSTHSPVRPNLIAMTRCKVISVKANSIEIESIDAFDGTPVLDIKS